MPVAGLAAAFALLVPPSITGCAINPVSRRPEFVAISAAKEKELGREHAEKVEKEMGHLDDEQLVAYVQEIGARLAKHSPRQDVEYTFMIVDMKEPNAFALPGGYIFVTRGLIALTNSEDELAGVIGHEIGHVAARHTVQRFSRAVPLIPIAIVTGIAGAVTSIVSPALGRALAGTGALAVTAVLAPYSRGQEEEADEVGQELAAAAGYDPIGISHFLHTLDRESTYTRGEARQSSFLDTHPATPSRVADTRERAAELTRQPGMPLAPTRGAYLNRIEGIVVGDDPAQGIFEEGLFLHPELGFAMRFPSNWKTQNQRLFVGAAEPGGGAALILRLAKEGDDPEAAARELADEFDKKMADRLETLRIGGLRAVRATSKKRGKGIHFTWIAHGGHVFLVTGVSESSRFERYKGTFESASGSFRPISAAESAGIEESRLRVRDGRPGETLEQFVSRTGGSWKAEKVAVANALEETARLQQGQLVKVAVPQAFEVRGRSSGG